MKLARFFTRLCSSYIVFTLDNVEFQAPRNFHFMSSLITVFSWYILAKYAFFEVILNNKQQFYWNFISEFRIYLLPVLQFPQGYLCKQFFLDKSCNTLHFVYILNFFFFFQNEKISCRLQLAGLAYMAIVKSHLLHEKMDFLMI